MLAFGVLGTAPGQVLLVGFCWFVWFFGWLVVFNHGFLPHLTGRCGGAFP